MSNLTILNTPIRTLDNLYSLNDLHIASGNNPNHRPNQFIRLETTKALAKAIEVENSNAQICAFKTLRGINGGTYACQELVIAYAAWISAAFHLKVIRAFMAMNGIGSQPQQRALPQPEPTFHFELDTKAIHNLVWLLYSHGQMNWLLGRLVKPLEMIGSSFAPTVYGNHSEYQRHYKECLPILRQFIQPLKEKHSEEWKRLLLRLTDF